MALVQAFKEGLWLWRLLRELGQELEEAFVIYCDNRGAVALAVEEVREQSGGTEEQQEWRVSSTECLSVYNMDPQELPQVRRVWPTGGRPSALPSPAHPSCQPLLYNRLDLCTLRRCVWALTYTQHTRHLRHKTHTLRTLDRSLVQ